MTEVVDNVEVAEKEEVKNEADSSSTIVTEPVKIEKRKRRKKKRKTDVGIEMNRQQKNHFKEVFQDRIRDNELYKHLGMYQKSCMLEYIGYFFNSKKEIDAVMDVEDETLEFKLSVFIPGGYSEKITVTYVITLDKMESIR